MLFATLITLLFPLFTIYLTVSVETSVATKSNSPLTSSLSDILRTKRYVTRKKRWRKNNLTWHLEKRNVNNGDQFLIRNTLHRAFQLWEGVSSVRFEERENDNGTDITISFERGRHMDDFPFDGQDGVVAHAFYPRDGRLHFDADEEWSLNSDNGVNLYQTAVHEIGHLLGLEHSENGEAVMLGAKRPYNPQFHLGEDDIEGVKELFPPESGSASNYGFGKKEAPPSVTTVAQVVDNLSMEQTQPPVNYRTQFPYPLPLDLTTKKLFIF